MMKTKRTLRQAMLALTAIAFLGFGLAACDNSTGSGAGRERYEATAIIVTNTDWNSVWESLWGPSENTEDFTFDRAQGYWGVLRGTTSGSITEVEGTNLTAAQVRRLFSANGMDFSNAEWNAGVQRINYVGNLLMHENRGTDHLVVYMELLN